MEKPLKYHFSQSAPKRFDLQLFIRKPLTKEIREKLVSITSDLEALTEWKLPKKS